MNAKETLRRPRVFGSAVVSPRGQVVIPVNARKELNIESGDTLLVCGPPHGHGLLLLKAEAVEQILSKLSEQLSNFEKLVKDFRPPGATGRKREGS